MNRHRNKTLIVVEGDHEKNTLIRALLECFREIPIKNDDVEVFGADIYDFYRLIEKEYGNNWYDEEDLDIDVPYLISKRNNINPYLNRNDYTNIIIVFDFERHDPCFSYDKLVRLQRCFDNVSDRGILYINYPMIESYLDVKSVPDSDYLDKKVSTTLQSGYEYKNYVNGYSYVKRMISASELIKKELKNSISETMLEKVDYLFSTIVSIRGLNNLEQRIESILNQSGIVFNEKKYLVYKTAAIIRNALCIDEGYSFLDVFRNMFLWIASENINKIWAICNNNSQGIKDLNYKYNNLDLLLLLERQWKCSEDLNRGYIWVVCTFMMIIAEYKFFWTSENEKGYKNIIN